MMSPLLLSLVLVLTTVTVVFCRPTSFSLTHFDNQHPSSITASSPTQDLPASSRRSRTEDPLPTLTTSGSDNILKSKFESLNSVKSLLDVEVTGLPPVSSSMSSGLVFSADSPFDADLASSSIALHRRSRITFPQQMYTQTIPRRSATSSSTSTSPPVNTDSESFRTGYFYGKIPEHIWNDVIRKGNERLKKLARMTTPLTETTTSASTNTWKLQKLTADDYNVIGAAIVVALISLTFLVLIICAVVYVLFPRNNAVSPKEAMIKDDEVEMKAISVQTEDVDLDDYELENNQLDDLTYVQPFDPGAASVQFKDDFALDYCVFRSPVDEEMEVTDPRGATEMVLQCETTLH